MQHYDFIIAGGGLAGLSLACHLVRSPLRDRSILIVDKDAKERDDRTWGFWSAQPLIFDELVYRSWGQLQVVGPDLKRLIDLGGYRYKVIRGIDFYTFARKELSAHENVSFAQGIVSRIQDGADEARVTVDGQTVGGTWVFDSLFRPSAFTVDHACYHRLKLHFEGWEIETPEPAFNPQAATLLDFRTPQKQETRFFYVLPYSERRALVEFTVFSLGLLGRREYDQALTEYLKNVLGMRDYRILGEESGVIPITDQPFPRRTGGRIMTVGAKGGRVKPTTGYAFSRVQHDSAAIVGSLLQHGHPFDVPADARRYRLYDSILLQIMSRHGDQIQSILGALFKNNPVGRVLRFLDEAASPWENLLLIATLPPWLFLQALLKKKVRQALARPLFETDYSLKRESR